MSAIKEVAVATLLHPFNRENVFFEDDLPEARVLGAKLVQGRCLRSFDGIIEFDVLYRSISVHRLENDGKDMVALYAEKNVWVDSDILPSSVPFLAQVRKIGHDGIILALELLIDDRSLT